jgi:hypothetical protein
MERKVTTLEKECAKGRSQQECAQVSRQGARGRFHSNVAAGPYVVAGDVRNAEQNLAGCYLGCRVG